MTKKQKTALLLDLLPVVTAIFVPLVEAKLKTLLTPPAAPTGRKWLVVAAVLAYAAFIALTVLFVKVAWRWVL